MVSWLRNTVVGLSLRMRSPNPHRKFSSSVFRRYGVDSAYVLVGYLP